MADYSKIIGDLENKVDKLIELNIQCQVINKNLKTTNEKVISQLETQKTRIGELEEELRVARLAKAVISSDKNDSYNLKLKINEYVREIDKCISNLNK